VRGRIPVDLPYRGYPSFIVGERGQMRIQVLGPLSVTRGATEVAPTAPKQRQTLALLLLNANRVVTMSQVVHELWAYDPPASAVEAVHIYVMQLRRSLGVLDAERLVTREHGYQLVVRSGELDLDVFSARVHSARLALARDELTFAAGQFHAALDLWHADALVDIEPGPILTAAVAGIERRRLDVVSQRIRVELRLGLHHELIGELSGLVHRHPADENLINHLMLALYRSGRQTDALMVFHALRTTLAQEHGVSPSYPLRRLYSDILSADQRLERPAAYATRMSLDLVVSP
jgi:SARP family transcriptional regulator, regulator of embCAB operon